MSREKGLNFVREFPASEPVVSMIEFKGQIVLATTRRVYRLNPVKDAFEAVDIVSDPTEATDVSPE